MLKSRINVLVELIPQKSNIYPDAKPAPRGATPPDVIIHRRACALLDPAFPWHFARAFAQLRQPLPALVHESYIKLAYEHIMNRAVNEDISWGQIIQHPKWQTKRGFLEALLLLPDLRLDEVAKYTGFSVATVLIYEQLFWNVRDRMNDPMYLNELCCPGTRLAEFQTDSWTTAEPRNLMLRAAYYNDLETLLKLFGTRMPHEEESPEVSAKQLKKRILSDAYFVVRAGGASSKVAVLDSARKLIVAAEKNYDGTKQGFRDDIIGLTALGLDPGQSVLETVKGLMDNTAYDRQLALQEAGNPEKN
jgi:hypothetical protein